MPHDQNVVNAAGSGAFNRMPSLGSVPIVIRAYREED
jgi:hypothetical protein